MVADRMSIFIAVYRNEAVLSEELIIYTLALPLSLVSIYS